MKTVKTMSDLQDLSETGKIKSVEGVRFIEKSMKPEVMKELISAIRDSINKNMQLGHANTRAMIAMAQGFSRVPVRVELKQSGYENSKRWVFTIERDSDGFVSKIIGEAE